MINYKYVFIMIFILAMCFMPANQVNAGGQQTIYNLIESDSPFSGPAQFYFFDLRERETFVQLTVMDGTNFPLPGSPTMHIQIFDVSNNCNENDFFDTYTANDTHIYNLRDIQTNDGNPSGVILPDGAYGIVAISLTNIRTGFFGNMRIIDNNGYEYRTNAVTVFPFSGETTPDDLLSFNFNQEGGVILSDIVGTTLSRDISSGFLEFTADPLTVFNSYDVDIYDLNEVPFSCRDVIFACVNQESVLLESLLEIAGTANVASFEYGINNSIPHSKGGELLCPGNTTDEGVVVLRPEPQPNVNPEDPLTAIFIGLNNGNGRGSLDSIWNFPIEDINNFD